MLTVAGHDHQTAAYALGAAVDGVVLDSLGTAEALLRTVWPPLSPDAIDAMAREGVTTGWGVVPGHLCLLAGLPTGISLERVGQLVGAATPAERIELGRQGLALDRSRTAMRLAATYHGVTLHDVDDEAAPALVWRVAVEDLIATAQHILGVMADQVGPHGDVVVTGGWLHNPLVEALKEAQYGGFAPGRLDEPGALGAAELAGVAAGLVAPRWDPAG